jgi:hypothetical protein
VCVSAQQIRDTNVHRVAEAFTGLAGVTLHGSLYVPADAQMMQWREFLLSRTGKDAALFLRKWLREALRKAGISTKMRFKTGGMDLPFPCAIHIRHFMSKP